MNLAILLGLYFTFALKMYVDTRKIFGALKSIVDLPIDIFIGLPAANALGICKTHANPMSLMAGR